MIETYYPEVHRLAAIFWDANNLKYVNDKYGHAAGDVLIQTLSSVLYELSTDRRKVYRVGGDEFVMIIENPVETEIESMIETVKPISWKRWAGRHTDLQRSRLGGGLRRGYPQDRQ